MRRSTILAAIWLSLFITFLFPFPTHAGWFEDTFIDPEDGKFDAGNYLESAKGFLPVPIIITEPAVGYGLGAAVAYFHKRKDIDKEKHPHPSKQSISVVFGAKTENETSLYGGAHAGVWKDDHIRYLGVFAKADINLDFYPETNDDGFEFNVDGIFLYQQIKFRLKESNWWLGADYLYVTADNSFKRTKNQEDIVPDPKFTFQQGGLGAIIEYDGRNSTFTPTEGMRANLKYRNFNEVWGGDYNYSHLAGAVNHYTPFGKYSSLGLRLEGDIILGDAPFFAYPYVNLRGIPAMRYQGEDVVTVEAEYLWGLTPRFTLVLFGGAGDTSSISDIGVEGDTVAAGGVGFRYRLARKLGFQIGMDIARGPEDTAVYLTMGSAWN